MAARGQNERLDFGNAWQTDRGRQWEEDEYGVHAEKENTYTGSAGMPQRDVRNFTHHRKILSHSSII